MRFARELVVLYKYSLCGVFMFGACSESVWSFVKQKAFYIGSLTTTCTLAPLHMLNRV